MGTQRRDEDQGLGGNHGGTLAKFFEAFISGANPIDDEQSSFEALQTLKLAHGGSIEDYLAQVERLGQLARVDGKVAIYFALKGLGTQAQRSVRSGLAQQARGYKDWDLAKRLILEAEQAVRRDLASRQQEQQRSGMSGSSGSSGGPRPTRPNGGSRA